MRRATALRTLLGRVVVQAEGRHVPVAATPTARRFWVSASSSSASASSSLLAASASSILPFIALLRHNPSSLLAASSSSSPLPFLALLRHNPALATTTTVRHNHCSCPTLRDDADAGPPRVRVAYDPKDVDQFIAVADALEDAYPGALVEGDDGEQSSVSTPIAGGEAPAHATGGPGCGHFSVILPGGKVAFSARSAPRDPAAVVAAVRASGGGALLAAAGEE